MRFPKCTLKTEDGRKLTNEAKKKLGVILSGALLLEAIGSPMLTHANSVDITEPGTVSTSSSEENMESVLDELILSIGSKEEFYNDTMNLLMENEDIFFQLLNEIKTEALIDFFGKMSEHEKYHFFLYTKYAYLNEMVGYIKGENVTEEDVKALASYADILSMASKLKNEVEIQEESIIQQLEEKVISSFADEIENEVKNKTSYLEYLQTLNENAGVYLKKIDAFTATETDISNRELKEFKNFIYVTYGYDNLQIPLDGMVITEFSQEYMQIVLDEKIPLSELTDKFPSSMEVKLEDGSQEWIYVSWVCENDYEQEDFDSYVFEATPEDGYIISDNCVSSCIMVTLGTYIGPETLADSVVYVDGQGGSDNNTGTAGSPFKTIQKAYSALASTGGIIYISGTVITAYNMELNPSYCKYGTTTVSMNSGKTVKIVRAPGYAGHFIDNKLYTLTLSGGIILDGNVAALGTTDCSAMIFNEGTLNITNAYLQNNYCLSDSTCGPVQNIGTCNMSGGTITGNTGYYGGGIYNYTGTFTMTGGTITGNIAKNGGGVYNTYGTFNFKGGTITGNEAIYNGGGMYNSYSSNFTMSAGTISNNIAGSNGGGIRNYGNSTVTITGGTISGNTSEEGGGGISSQGTAVISGGSITGNKADENGGGIHNTGTLTVTAGTISGNTASGNGNGVYQNGTMYMNSGGVINSGNDVYLYTGKYITVNGALTNSSVATVTPNTYSKGRICVSVEYSSTVASKVYEKFTLTPSAGWYLEAGDLLADGEGVSDTHAVVWEIPTYTVVYNANGGSGTMSSSEHVVGVASNLSANTFTRTGYTFNGWNTKANGSGTSYSNQQSVTGIVTSGSVTLYAQWKANTYTVNYNGNGNTGGSTSSSTHTYDVAKNLTANGFTKTGYTFNGWNTKADCTGNSYSNQQSVTNLATSGSITLYAQWKANTYTVVYNGNGNGGGTTATSTHTYDVAKALTANGYTRTGYTFNGWNTKADGTGTSYSNQQSVTNLATSGSITLYAQWKANSYTVNYNGNGSTSGSTASSTHTYDVAKALTANGFARTGYTFNGWNTKADGTGYAYSNQQSVTNLTSSGSITLYAQWKANTYTVNYNGNGSTSGSMSASTHTYDSAKTLTANKFVRTGYTFNGWNTKADGTGTSYSDKQSVTNLATSGSITLYAQWKANTYTINYNGNGNTGGSTASSTHTYDVAKNLTANGFTKTGYIFNGWNTKADGTGNSYSNQQSVTNLATSGSITLYAQWKANTYTVVYNGNGNTSGSTTSSTHTYDAAKNLTANGFRKTGYTFDGWNTKADGSGTSYSDKQSVINLTAGGGTVTLYAQWKANTYTISYDGNGNTGGSTASSSHTYDAQKILTANGFTKTGYTFAGWNTEADGSGDFYADKTSVKNLTAMDKGTVTLYAQWKANTYTVNYNGNGNTGGSTASSTHTYDVAKNLTANGFVKTGYDFIGWNSKADGSGTFYSDRQSVINLTTAVNGTVTLYAQWTISKRTLKVSADIQVTDYILEYGTPSFFVKVSGTDMNGKSHVWYDCVSITEPVIRGVGNGYVRLELEFEDIISGTYTVEVEETYRYKVSNISGTPNVTYSGEKAIAELESAETADVLFTLDIAEYGLNSHSSFIRNMLWA